VEKWNKNSVVIVHRNGDALVVDVFADDSSTLPDFRNAISAIALHVLGPAGEAGFIEFFFG